MGATVLTISAVDRDSQHNGMISYKILSSSEGFSIDHKNGESVSMVYYFSLFTVNCKVLFHASPVASDQFWKSLLAEVYHIFWLNLPLSL